VSKAYDASRAIAGDMKKGVTTTAEIDALIKKYLP